MPYELFYLNGGVVLTTNFMGAKVVVMSWKTFQEYVNFVDEQTKILHNHYEFIEKVMGKPTPKHIVDFINSL